MGHNGKGFLRKITLEKLADLTHDDKKVIETQLKEHLLKSACWKNAKTIGITCATELEWNTIPIIQHAWKEGKTVAVPKTNSSQSTMEFYQIDYLSQLRKGYGDILEPITDNKQLIKKQEIDLLIVPGVIFDEYGYRIGFGGGYYDRYLVDFKHETVSLLSTFQLVRSLPIEKHDIHVQYLITENGLRKVKQKK
ncbi:MAG TPA: 5-formyltetrahydrofolate cyclo-ligase [Pseudogracilibacillus sp.]|nr:5-formyltetrahydrofolate cyclo-ligase [Pseudogracilibacillus sp.]